MGWTGCFPERRTGEALNKSTVFTTLNALRTFFQWLAGQPGYRTSLTYSDSDYFNLSEKETRAAKALSEKKTPGIEQILHALQVMPDRTEIEKRDRAVIAFTLITGVRDGAAASLKLKHVDLVEGKVTGRPRGEDQVLENVHNMVLSGGGRGSQLPVHGTFERIRRPLGDDVACGVSGS